MGVPYAPDVHSVARFLHPGRKNSVVEHVLRLDYEVGLGRDGWLNVQIIDWELKKCTQVKASSIYTINVGTHKKNAESKNRVNQDYLVVLKGGK